MSALESILLALGVAATAIVAAILLPGRTGRAIGFAGLTLSGLCALAGGMRALGEPAAAFAGSEALHTAVRLDPLSAFFVTVIAVVATAVGIYALGGRTADERSGGRTAAAVSAAILFASLLICVADDALLFVFAWELLAVAFYWAAGFAGSDPGGQRAGYVTAVVTHAAGAGLIAALLILARGDVDFSLRRLLANAPSLSAPLAGAVFLLFLVAFGAKLGAMPLQAWLPLGYTAAPSLVAALMAGGALNVGFYGIVRFLIAPAWPVPLWWGMLVLAIGGISAFLGIAYAVAQHDLRSLAAYSSIENGGIVVAALGAALVAKTLHLPLLLGMAVAAAFLHLTAHAFAKALLFLGASSIRSAAGTTSFQRLGGLAGRLPATALLTGVATLSLAALPPLAGFAGEWSVLETLMQAFRLRDTTAEVTFALAAAAIGVAAGLAIVAFTKALGVAILGAPRTPEAQRAQERLGARAGGMAILALGVVAVGVFAPAYLGWIAPAVDGLAGVGAARAMIATAPLLAPSYPGFASISPLGLLAQFVGFGALFALFVALIARPKARRSPVWTSGNVYAASTSYTGTGFVNPTRAISAPALRTERIITVEGPRLAPRSIRYESRSLPLFDLPFYRKVAAAMLRIADLARATQSGAIAAYLSYILVFVIGVLLFYPSIRNW